MSEDGPKSSTPTVDASSEATAPVGKPLGTMAAEEAVTQSAVSVRGEARPLPPHLARTDTGAPSTATAAEGMSDATLPPWARTDATRPSGPLGRAAMGPFPDHTELPDTRPAVVEPSFRELPDALRVAVRVSPVPTSPGVTRKVLAPAGAPAVSSSTPPQTALAPRISRLAILALAVPVGVGLGLAFHSCT